MTATLAKKGNDRTIVAAVSVIVSNVSFTGQDESGKLNNLTKRLYQILFAEDTILRVQAEMITDKFELTCTKWTFPNNVTICGNAAILALAQVWAPILVY